VFGWVRKHNGARLFGGKGATLAREMVDFLTLNHQRVYDVIAGKEKEDVVAIQSLEAGYTNHEQSKSGSPGA